MTPAEFCLILAALVFSAGATFWFIRRYRLTRPNFRQEQIPAVAGLFFLIYGEIVYTSEWISLGLNVGSAAAYLLVTFGFGVLGLTDDLWGNRKESGFRGHFQALARGRLTTGAAKAIGGAVVSLVASYLLYYPLPWRMLLAAVLIALTANTLNLLDLRPGRSLFGFFVGAGTIIVTLCVHQMAGYGFLFYLAVAAAVLLYPWDAFGKVMLGDTGSNAFGAVLGVTAALYYSPFWQLVCIAAMLVFQIWCESHSLSATIERVPFLRRIDRKIGVR